VRYEPLAFLYPTMWMNLEEQLEILTSKGFSASDAETIVLMREALVVLFDAFPDSLLLIGGAHLLLFNEHPPLFRFRFGSSCGASTGGSPIGRINGRSPTFVKALEYECNRQSNMALLTSSLRQ